VSLALKPFSIFDYLIAGWSDQVFDVLSAIDKGEDALKAINSIEI